MDLFLCWSGTASREIAMLLRTWLRDVIQKLRPFLSEEDIRKGGRWRDELAAKLAATHFGIICLTPENLSSEWILFEAGALSKNFKQGDSVTALLCGVAPEKVVGPLNQFQHTGTDKDSVFKLMRDINELLPQDQRLEDDRLQRAFQTHWAKLEEGIRRALTKLHAEKPQQQVKRSVEEMLGEILAEVRQLKVSAREVNVAAARVDASTPTPKTGVSSKEATREPTNGGWSIDKRSRRGKRDAPRAEGANLPRSRGRR